MDNQPARLRLGATTLFALALLLAWDFSGLDMALAHTMADASGFVLRDHVLLKSGLHEGGRIASWLVVLGLSMAVWWPVGGLRRIPPQRRVQLVVTALVSVVLISAVKSFSATSCPWDLADFGGVARYTLHWTGFALPDGGGGRCFPAGHASAGFAFVGGYFAFRRDCPALARRWLATALAAGLLLGLAQQLRGAHFMSHTLWTGWLCWCTAWAIDSLLPLVLRHSVQPQPITRH